MSCQRGLNSVQTHWLWFDWDYSDPLSTFRNISINPDIIFFPSRFLDLSYTQHTTARPHFHRKCPFYFIWSDLPGFKCKTVLWYPQPYKPSQRNGSCIYYVFYCIHYESCISNCILNTEGAVYCSFCILLVWTISSIMFSFIISTFLLLTQPVKHYERCYTNKSKVWLIWLL